MEIKRRHLSDFDREAIRKAVEALPDVDHRIIDMTLEQNGEVIVQVGVEPRPFLPGLPPMGKGDVLIARLSETGNWSVAKTGYWIS